MLVNPTYQDDYSNVVEATPFKREILKDFTRWKTYHNRSILRLEGARQTGKTSHTKRFCYENYHNVIYIDLTNTKQHNDLSACLSNTTGSLKDRLISTYLKPSVTNLESTVLIIDEIQLSLEIYNRLKELKTSVSFDIIVTGSYMSVVKNMRTYTTDNQIHGDAVAAVGYVHTLRMYPLSFK